MNKSGAPTFPMQLVINRKSRQQDYADRMRSKPLGDASWGLVPAHRAGRKRVVAQHMISSREHVRTRGIILLVDQSKPLEPIIE